MKKIVHLIFRLNLFKTIYVNFKLLPIQQAIRLPVWIYHKVALHGLTGKIEIPSSVSIHSGMMRVGYNLEMIKEGYGKCQLTILGTLILKGGSITLGNSVKFIIARNACMEIGAHSNFGTGVKVIATHRIVLGKYFRMSYESQMMDSAFHYIMDIKTREVRRLYGYSIIIGDYVWVGNRCTLMKGAEIPSKCMITSNSLINKSYIGIEENSVIGGIPAKLISSGKSRVYNGNSEKQILRFFEEHKDLNSYILPNEINIY